MKDFTTLTIEFPLHTALLPKYAVNTLFMYIKHLKIHHSWCYQPQSVCVCVQGSPKQAILRMTGGCPTIQLNSDTFHLLEPVSDFIG